MTAETTSIQKKGPLSSHALIVGFVCLLLLIQVLPLLHARWVEDESWYSVAADSLAHHGELRMRVYADGQPESRVFEGSPLTSVLLAGYFKVFGTGLYSAKLFCLTCATGGILLVYLLGCELRSSVLGLIAAVFVAVDNLYFLAARTVRPEISVALFGSAGVLIFLYSQRRRSVPLACLAGIVSGAAMLVHPNGLAAPVTAGVFALAEFRFSIVYRIRPWAFLAGLVLVMIPFALWVSSDAAHWEEFRRGYLSSGHSASSMIERETARYADFIGMPSARLRLPLRVPYRAHIALALVGAAYVLFRRNRTLFWKIFGLLGPCIVVWACLANPTVRYMATGAPYYSLLLAAGILVLFEGSLRWRAYVVSVGVLLVASQVATNYLFIYMYRNADYSRTTAQLRALIPRDATVYGALTFWMSLHDQPFWAWNHTPLSYALDRGASYLILNDRVLVSGEGYGVDDWRNLRLQLGEFVKTRAVLVGRAPSSFYGDLEVYRVNDSSRSLR